MQIQIYDDNFVAIDTIYVDDELLTDFLRISSFAKEYGCSRQSMHAWKEYNGATWADTFRHFKERSQKKRRKTQLAFHEMNK
ncbi:hypothetical protein ACQUO7_005041 [Escherichia coli]|nr:hypothetical protein [Escherichia coli]EFE9462089.1 hypothetical protein [Escherichia coli]EFF3759532.1 hypothetical protein [Escherichia coli]EFF4760464.1 hypothetical protein [Escherichia coli]EFH2739013.1 hypothetical protein [Escherichia coli]